MIEVLLQAESALSVGLLDQAEILYRQVAIADPRNAIAVVGLARVALERGDEPGALAQARRALAIDGENSAAQRMVQRLEEVLAYRGHTAPTTLAPLPVAPAAGGVRATDARPATDLPAADPSTTESARTVAAPIEPPPDPPPAHPTGRSWIDRIVRRNG